MATSFVNAFINSLPDKRSVRALAQIFDRVTPAIVTATAAAGAVTLNSLAGKITTEALITAGLAAYTLTLTNNTIVAGDIIFVKIAQGTSTTGTPILGRAVEAAGSAVIVINNVHATVALNGTLVVSFFVEKS